MRFPRLTCDVSPVDPNRRRAAKSKLAGHSFVGDEHLTNVYSYAFRGQDILDELYRRRMRRALRYVQDFAELAAQLENVSEDEARQIAEGNARKLMHLPPCSPPGGAA